eukprot:TRINITY_DN5793_c0_g1_i1.p1 TRINITY_DN5793_c0_g1~~TRINITY_DN5793_c0_g1_i1.p1  ORF type:complete len:524 (-),score=111.63 TRINITY_DN5793_c0_g1_i1:94-1665(-)
MQGAAEGLEVPLSSAQELPAVKPPSERPVRSVTFSPSAAAAADADAGNRTSTVNVTLLQRAQRNVGRDGVEELPDLRPALESLGVLAEYEAFQRNYARWRKGDARGATGELARRATRKFRGEDIELYPENGHTIFKFRLLAAYGATVLFILGSLLFSLNSWFVIYGVEEHKSVTMPNFIGGIAFCLGAYLSYFQLLNMTVKQNERPHYFVTDWEELRRRTDLASRVGTYAYFFGALVFQISCTLELFPRAMETLENTRILKWIVYDLPNCIGCILFVLGGISELVHLNMIPFCGRRAFSGDDDDEDDCANEKATCRDVVWWVAVGNNAGSFAFLAAYCPPLFGFDWPQARHYLNFVGSIMFAFASVGLLLMWRSDDFGLALLKQLNFSKQFKKGVLRRTNSGVLNLHVQLERGELPDAAGSEETRRTLSANGILFILILCWQTFCMVGRFCVEEFSGSVYDTFRRVQSVIIILIVVLMLLMQGVALRVPKVEPFRSAMLAARGIFVAYSATETYMFLHACRIF